MLTDNRGTEVCVGAKVCFNYQGSIAFGSVTDVKMVERYGRSTPKIKVKRTHPTDGESVVTS